MSQAAPTWSSVSTSMPLSPPSTSSVQSFTGKLHLFQSHVVIFQLTLTRIQPELKPEPTADGISKLVTSSPFVANYIGPAPPPPSASHRYVFLLYEQPEDFDAKKYAPTGGKKMGNWNRMRYDLGAFVKEIKLGPVVACNYFNSK